MGEIVLAFVGCLSCRQRFPIEVKGTSPDYGHISQNDLEEIPKYCPFCGSKDLNFKDLMAWYFG